MRRFKYIIISTSILFSSGSLMAQQDPMFTQYMFNSLAINPAYAGSRNVVSATALLRSQWTGIEGAPKTGTFTIDAPIVDKHFGVGLQLLTDKLGVTQNNAAALSLAYRIRLEEATLSFGLQGNVSQYRADLTSVSLGSTSAYDPAFAYNVNKSLFNFGSGVYYNTDHFYAGLSAQDLIPNRLSDANQNGDKLAGKQALHVFLSSGYVFPIAEDLNLKPSFLLKYVHGSPIEGDINGTLWIKDVIGIGAQYRTSADIAGLLEIQATSQFRIGYSYDRSVTQLQNFNSGSHEIMLRYEFGFERGKIISPRYF
jgi:type IX secretion system PorP/SprF family membrane protein